MSTKKILFIVHLPPPVHGVSVMNRIIKNSTLINQAFSCDFINISLASGPDDFRKHDVWVELCKICGGNPRDEMLVVNFEKGKAYTK